MTEVYWRVLPFFKQVSGLCKRLVVHNLTLTVNLWYKNDALQIYLQILVVGGQCQSVCGKQSIKIEVLVKQKIDACE